MLLNPYSDKNCAKFALLLFWDFTQA